MATRASKRRKYTLEVSIFDLPRDILGLIFSFLSKEIWLSLHLVCKTWCKVARYHFDPSMRDNAAIKWACSNGKLECLRYLMLDSRVNITVGNNTPFQKACISGHLHIVRELLNDHRVNPAAKGNVALCWAARYGQTEIVKELLLDHRVDPSAGN
jgi:hypothetical protein